MKTDDLPRWEENDDRPISVRLGKELMADINYLKINHKLKLGEYVRGLIQQDIKRRKKTI